MEKTSHLDDLAELGLFDRRVPRYTSYPTAPIFNADTGEAFQKSCIEALDPAKPISVYVHIPFCERLCWFCACRTQGTRSLGPLETYLASLKTELEHLKSTLPDGVKMGQMHWGGGTPTILPPHMILELAQAIKAVIPPAEKFEFSVEIDPTLIDEGKIAALKAEGFNRASLGVQDFAPEVQAAIGRDQSFEHTKKCMDMIRAAGVQSLNIDLVYGLPHQTLETIAASTQQVLELDPDRLALFGYAHVPWMAKRQTLIDEAVLPGDHTRHALFNQVADGLSDAGYRAIGIDHFAKPGDALSEYLEEGKLRRNFQGYTADPFETLIGLGASSISRFEQGYVQNAAATGAYNERINAGHLAGYRGHAFTNADRLHSHVIEMLMCNFELDLAATKARFGLPAESLLAQHRAVADKFGKFVELDEHKLTIKPEGRPLTRIIAYEYDQYVLEKVAYSRAS